jgi:hypothetical protein
VLILAADWTLADAEKLIVGAVLGSLLTFLFEIWKRRAQFDDRLRLEKEYALYAAIWEHLFDLRAALQIVSEDAQKAVRIHFSEVRKKFQAATEKAGPFTTTTIRDKCAEIVRMCERVEFVGTRFERICARRDQLGLDPDPEDAKINEDEFQKNEQEGFDLHDAIVEEINNVETAMRERVGPPKKSWRLPFGI